MRGLILLCLWGLFLEASTATWLHGSQLPMSGPSSFEIKANTSTEHEEHGPNNTSSQVTATPLTVESTAVVMLSKDREDRQLSKDSTTPVPKSKPKPNEVGEMKLTLSAAEATDRIMLMLQVTMTTNAAKAKNL
ncbi:uncharacterized protein ACO6RY_13101 [Pungitius sinensis]